MRHQRIAPDLRGRLILRELFDRRHAVPKHHLPIQAREEDGVMEDAAAARSTDSGCQTADQR